jgi:hypothetical protein
MANSVKIKRGSGVPSSSDLAVYELGYRTGTSELYINDNGTYRQVGGTSGGGAVDSIANFADNRVLTASDADSIRGEGNLTFDGSTLAITGALTTTSTINIAGDATFQSHINMGDSDQLKLGSDADMKIQHTGNHGYITNDTGHLYIRSGADDKQINIQADDGSGGMTDYMRFSGVESIIRVYKNTRFSDSVNLQLGTGNDFQLKHDGSNNYIQSRLTGNLIIEQQVDDADIVLKSDNGSGGTTAYLTLDGSAKDIDIAVPTNIDGAVTITEGSGTNTILNLNGAAATYLEKDTGTEFYIANNAQDKDIILRVNDGGSNVNAIQIDASDNARVKLPNDNQRLSIGASNDIQITHDGTNSYIDNYTGNLNIKNNEADKDLILLCDDGSGGETAYLTLDGSTKNINIDVTTRIKKDVGDGGIFYMGADSDLALYVTGNHAIFRNYTSDGDIYFSVNDGGSAVNAIIIDGSDAGTAIFNQDIRLETNATYIHSTDASGNKPRMFGINGSNTTYIGPIDSYAGGRMYYGASSNMSGHNFYTGGTVRMKLDGYVLDLPNTGDWSFIKNNTNSGGLRFGTKDSGGTYANQIEISNTGNYVKLNENTSVTGYSSATEHFQLNFAGTSNSLLKIVNSGWSNETTHDILFNYWQSNLGDYTYLKSAGNSTSGHGIALVGDSVFAVGDTTVATGAVTNSATAPFTDTWFTVNGSGNGVFKGSVTSVGSSTTTLNASSTITTNYGVAFTNGATNFLQYNNSTENVLYMRDTTNGSMLQTWGVNTVTMNKNTSVQGDLNVSGNSYFQYGLVVNEGGHNADFRVEGDTQTNLLKVDASADKVGINEGSPSFKLDVNGDLRVVGSGDHMIRFTRSGADVVSIEQDSSQLYFYNRTTSKVMFLMSETGSAKLGYNSNPTLELRNTATSAGSGSSLIFGHSQSGTTQVARIESHLLDGSESNRAGNLEFWTSRAGTPEIGYDTYKY